MKLTGAQIVIETLIEQGCDTVFGYPGGSVLDIYDQLYVSSDRIHHVITAHEQGASHAADGYARATGKTGVVIATSGPGATNLVTGIATAYLDSTPMVAITGNVSCALLGRDSFQEVNIVGITMAITKHNYIVKDIAELADTIREAFSIANSGRPGPILIDIPKDIQTCVCEFVKKEKYISSYSTDINENDLSDAVKLISQSERPYIYCGGGSIISGASSEIMALSKKIDAPIGSSIMGLSAIPASFENALGMQGMHGRFASSKAKSKSDLLIAIGVRFSDRATGNKEKYAEGKKIIHIDIDRAEFDKNINVGVKILGDIKTVLGKLNEKVSESRKPQWQDEIKNLREMEKSFEVKTDAITPYSIIETVNEAASPDTVIATDVGQHQMWVAQRYKFEKTRTFLTSGGLGTMGFGMGAAIGAAIGTKKRTVLFTGDGSFGMNLNEMATAVSNNLPLIIIVMNNGVLGMVRQWQTLFYKEYYSQTILNRKTDFVKLAKAFGAGAYCVTNNSQLKEAVKNAFEKNSPVLIDCHIDENEFVLPMMPPGGTIDQIIVKRGEN